MSLGEQIGQRIKDLMAAQNLNNVTLATRLKELREGSTVEGFRSQLINWKAGRIPDQENAALLGAALGVDPSEFRPAEATQAEFERVIREQEQHEAEMRGLVAQLNDVTRRLADRAATDRQPKELPKPGSRTRRNA